MEKLFPTHVVAEIHFIPTAEGGKKLQLTRSLFGCPLNLNGDYFDMRIDLSEVGIVSPGDTVRVPMAFLSPELILPRLRVGSEFTLWEGRTVARGRVTEISPPKNA